MNIKYKNIYIIINIYFLFLNNYNASLIDLSWKEKALSGILITTGLVLPTCMIYRKVEQIRASLKKDKSDAEKITESELKEELYFNKIYEKEININGFFELINQVHFNSLTEEGEKTFINGNKKELSEQIIRKKEIMIKHNRILFIPIITDIISLCSENQHAIFYRYPEILLMTSFVAPIMITLGVFISYKNYCNMITIPVIPLIYFILTGFMYSSYDCQLPIRLKSHKTGQRINDEERIQYRILTLEEAPLLYEENEDTPEPKSI